MPGKLFMVATPIGNLEDATFRAIRTLKDVDAIFSEDTRVTRKLLARYDIHKPLFPYYQHSGPKALERLLAMLREGRRVAYVSCAGTPAVSDPGPRLVAAAVKEFGPDITVVPIPGSSAVTAIASLAAVPMDEFHFFGYPPQKKGRRTYFQDVAENPYPGVLFESPHRIKKMAAELLAALGAERRVVVGRELTKKFEEVMRGTVGEVALRIAGETPRGEYVVLVEPPRKRE
ncbi:MAG: 16S rRNA (cytidine(1402)-2'-O)-methyltransferase [Candidatus Terrybacteria bacterium]|nr:16S rRNA (cytidine(1402)-2'-O)-methyltransferase [Candidatus Terrybacteria bacterium]